MVRIKKKKCAECRRLFTPERNSRKFCSHFCYTTSMNRKYGEKSAWGINRRKQLMATGIFGEQQIKQFARELNSTNAPQTEKEILLADLIIETRLSKREMVDRRIELDKTPGGSSALHLAQEVLAKTPGVRLRGVFWCKECGNQKVDKPNSTCRKCKEAKYTVQVPEIGDDFIIGDISRDDLRRKDRSHDL